MSRKSLQNNILKVVRLNLSAQDDVAGIVPVKTTIFSVPCRIRQLNAIERGVGGKDGVISSHRIYCNKIDIRNKDEAIVNSKIYDVNTINPGSANKSTIEVDCTLRN